ncbi:MAG: hypothetical protein ACRDRO_17365 [Pseudonocardiaceae bacterium]
MAETTAPPDTTLVWYLRSLGDHDTHRGRMRADGTVLACCGLSFTPRPTLRIAGPPPGELVAGPLALPAPRRTRSRSAGSANAVMPGERFRRWRRCASRPAAPP